MDCRAKAFMTQIKVQAKNLLVEYEKVNVQQMQTKRFLKIYG